MQWRAMSGRPANAKSLCSVMTAVHVEQELTERKVNQKQLNAEINKITSELVNCKPVDEPACSPAFPPVHAGTRSRSSEGRETNRVFVGVKKLY